MSSPFAQARYQVRLDWAVAGLERLEPADITVVVDVLRLSTAVGARVDGGAAVVLDEVRGTSVNGAAVAARADELGSLVLLGSLRNRSAVASAVLAEQRRRGARTSIAVIAAGERESREADAPVRFAVEDLLGAGAVVDALTTVGIDHTSPEAAAACEAFRGLGGAVRHLLSASGSGQELLGRDLADDVRFAAAIDATETVPVLRDGVFTA